jgi:hypothetical protein
MGVRLYPNTTNPESLEKLAKVPAGTHARLLATEERHRQELAALPGMSSCERQEAEYAQWKEINDDDAMGTLSAFLAFGWGKFSDMGVAEGCSGHLDDLEQVWILLVGNSIWADIRLTEGVHWC